MYFRKGAAVIEQFFDVEFCLLLFFIPDSLVRSTVREFADRWTGSPAAKPPLQAAARVNNDTALTAFFESMRTYFAGREKPSEPLLRLKVQELILSILTGRSNRALAAYFQSLALESGFEDVAHFSRVFKQRFRVSPSAYRHALPAAT